MAGLLSFGRGKATPARLLLSIPIIVLCVWGAIKLSIGIWADDVVEGLSEDNDIAYESTFFGLNGDFGVKGLSVVHSLPDGTDVGTYAVDRVIVHPPGPFWLLRNSWFKTTADLPDDFSVTLENARNISDSDSTPGNYSNLPYDAIGCGVKLLTPALLREMGFPSVARNVTVGLHQSGASKAILDFTMATAHVGDLQMKFDLDFPRPVKWRDTLISVINAPIEHVSLSMADRGFITPRNSFCSKRSGISEAAFPAFHRKALADYMQSSGLGFSNGVMDRYGTFATSGGELRLSSNNERPILFGKFMEMGRAEKFTAFPLQLSLNGGPGTAFAFLPAAAAPAGSLPMATLAATAGPARTSPFLPPAADAAGMTPAASRVVAFRELEHMLGAHVEVQTVNDTIRRGTVAAYASMMISMRLDPAEGGFMLAIPSSTVAKIQLLGDAPPAMPGASNAQAH